MAKQIPGQLSFFDNIKPENDENLQKMTEKCKTCATCTHFCWVWNYDEPPYRKACFGFVISRSDDPDQEACEAYEKREEVIDG